MVYNIKQDVSFIKATLTATSLDINENVTLAHVKQSLEIASEIIKNRSTTLNIKKKKKKKNMELSKKIWEIKNRNGTSKITWKIIRLCRSYNPNRKRCLLCLNEKYKIETYKADNLFNKRTEIINTCRHRSQYNLGNC